MLFNSLQFLVFFPVVVALYFALPYRFRWILLLGASYYFYMAWKPEYAILLVISTVVDYWVALQIGKTTVPSHRKRLLILSLFCNLGLLFTFKYFNFFNDSLRALFDRFNIFYDIPHLEILLPVGISFYTFQSVSYIIDVYRGHTPPEKHLGIYALFVSFFPQLVAGPIERSSHLLPQFYQKYTFDYQRVSDGLKLMAWGFFKKLVIADRLAVYVNQVYNHPADHQGLPVILATYFFAFQIYCDFSGYSDIAVGAAQVMGYNLMDNFKQPYFSRSIPEFWQRWHISLSTWFRDYLYIPLGGNRVAPWRWQFNLFVVFLISGLWHGANWTFVIWGALHGFYFVFSIWTTDIRNKISQLLRLDQIPLVKNILAVFITFHLVVFSWIFFRANSMADAFLIIRQMFQIDLSNPQTILLFDLAASPINNWTEVIVAISAILILEVVHLLQRRWKLRTFLSNQPFWFRWPVYYVAAMIIVLFGKFNSQEAFIYFQF